MNDRISLYSALSQQMMKGEDERTVTPGREDPLLRRIAANIRKASEWSDGAAKTEPNKRPKLPDSATSLSAAIRKKTEVVPFQNSPLLHQSCILFAKCAPVIESALEMEPQAACKRAQSVRKGNNSSFIVGDARVPYSLPINILLHQDAAVEAIQLMAEKAPAALAMKDGRDECSALLIALRLRGRASRNEGDEEDAVEEEDGSTAPRTAPEAILAANPTTAQLHDKKRNFPLHVAAYVGSSFSMIRKLYYAYPEALLEMNFYGETPLDICIRNGKCSDVACNFLQEKLNHLKLARLRGKVPR